MGLYSREVQTIIFNSSASFCASQTKKEFPDPQKASRTSLNAPEFLLLDSVELFSAFALEWQIPVELLTPEFEASYVSLF